MEIMCHGGMIDGHIVKNDHPAQTIHRHGMTVLRIHQPYPRRKGERVTERLVTYTESYALCLDPEAGLVYRCDAPFGGLVVGGVKLPRTEGGGYDVYADRSGKLHAGPPEAA